MGILKAGAAYLPLDPSYPPQRLAYMLEDARVPVLLTQQRLLERLPEPRARALCLDGDWAEIAGESEQNPEPGDHQQHPVYVIYTSGSTGTPKGVLVRNRSLVNLCYGLQEFFTDPQVSQTALITSISFDISVNQIFPTLLFGRTLHVIADEVKYNPAAFIKYVRERGIELFDCVPSYLNGVLTALPVQDQAPLDSRLRYILMGGEKIERSLLTKVFGRLGANVALVNIYGLTELTDINALSVISAAEAADVITIGKPLANTRIYITDENYNLQPAGVSGELCIAGDGVSRGYLNRPELTAEKFVPAPWGAGEVMCRTGDLGRWLSDGRIELLGRRDQQVKIRGYRIEVGEVAAVLESHPCVREAVVLLREDLPGDKRLVAYVVPHTATTAAQLLNFSREKLPDYMVPASCLLLDELPHLPNGKINRNALPAPEDLYPDLGLMYVAPQTDVERILARIWQDVLQTPKVGIYDNFFSDLGGNSLMLIQVVEKVRESMNRDVSMIEMFQFPTIDSLARHFSEGESQPSSIEKIDDHTQRRRQAMRQRRQLKQDYQSMIADFGAKG
jgi:amino acid adenylation domain-containing protein